MFVKNSFNNSTAFYQKDNYYNHLIIIQKYCPLLKFNLNNKSFIALENSSSGEVGEGTIFTYHQDKNLIWAEYKGGSILKGLLSGIYISKDKIKFNYHHVNKSFELMSGVCESTLLLNEDGKIILDEKWQWTCGDKSKGISKLIEIDE